MSTGHTFTFSYEFQGFEKWAKMLLPKTYQKHFRRHVHRATGQNALFMASAMRKSIQGSKGLKRNAPLTIAIKGADKPLVDHADLFKNIAHNKIDELTYFVGLKRTEGDFNLAQFLHDGGQIPVTEKMRGMFFNLWRASEGKLDASELTGRAAELWARMQGGWKPLKPDTEVIVIPGRPFVTLTLQNPALRKQMTENWNRAMKFVFRDMKHEFFGGGKGQ